MLAGKGFTLSRPRAVPSRTSPPQLGQKVRLAGGLRSHQHLKASAAARSLSAVNDQIFNRKEELAALNEVFDDSPSELLILLGPANCGKTKLLQEVKKDRELAQAVIGQGPPPILYLDCRGKDISSPRQFANAIRQLIIGDAGLKNWWAGIKLKFPGFELDLEKIFEPATGKRPMESIIASLTTFLEATRPLPYKPVIIIDEANVLLDWHDDPGRTQLKALLRFFVRTTKQEHLGHFVLASSESFVVDFLEKEGLHTKQYVTQEIGDLATIDEAKQFVQSLMLWVSKDLEDAVKSGLWPRGFSKTGGSRSPPAWTKEDYKTVLREIFLAKEHKHAVSFDKLRVEPGEDALLSMVEWNLVGVRRRSSWAKDVPETVFTDLKDTKLVMMPSPVELYFVLKMHEDGKLDAEPPNDDK
ncbi:hypothetical protein KSW81_001475 [Nannochloris sp. 'desiccata']|nr:hypothetical protein KSW81_001475 [Chlorella desiccata (nom. nud.)]